MNLFASLIFFTRIPFWRLRKVPTESFKHVVAYWSLVGWLTGGVMAGVLWLASQVLPLSTALLLAFISRLLLTGALHEDGLADFFDGFGGGTTRERTLSIMKDSHMGSYGVIGLILYFLLAWSLLVTLPLSLLCGVLFTADIWSKFVASQLINFLPYARKAEESKAKVVYNRMSFFELSIALISATLPFILWPHLTFWLALLLPIMTFIFLCLLMKKRLQGYTGDCCGALFLFCELSYYLGITLTLNIWK